MLQIQKLKQENNIAPSKPKNKTLTELTDNKKPSELPDGTPRNTNGTPDKTLKD